MNKSGRPRGFNREDVLDAAINVFRLKGYNGCSTEDLCRSTGLGRGSLYNAFGSKHELYEQSLHRYHDYWLKVQLSILSQANLTSIQKLRSLLVWAVEQDFNGTNKSCLLISATMNVGQTDPVVKEVANRHVKELENAFHRVILAGIEAGEIPSTKTAQELSSVFLCNFYGLRTINAAVKNRDYAMKIIDGTIASLS